MRYSTVFNVSQCEGLDIGAPPALGPDHNPIAACEAIAADYLTGPAVKDGPQACYRPSADVVELPARRLFESAETYYSTLFHELGHSTGHENRLAREGITDRAKFASHAYSKEELVAEMTACFLAAEAGIEAATVDNAASYIASWLRRLRDDRRLFLEAAGAAQKAADHIRGRSFADARPGAQDAQGEPAAQDAPEAIAAE